MKHTTGADGPLQVVYAEGMAQVVLIVMGVSGSGKSTVGAELAKRLAWAFVDSDEFHSPENIEKMRHDQPLTAADRAPWISAIVTHLNEQAQSSVLACSALTRDIRERFRRELLAPPRFIYLCLDRNTLRARLEQRKGHFASSALLDSQLATLEPPQDALVLDGRKSPAELCDEIVQNGTAEPSPA